jgi:hypothetical protein
MDIKSYLESLYDIQVKDVRTMVYLGQLQRVQSRGRLVNKRLPTYKKAIVTMGEDFVFPDPADTEGLQMLPTRVDKPFGKSSHSDFKGKIKKRQSGSETASEATSSE